MHVNKCSFVCGKILQKLITKNISDKCSKTKRFILCKVKFAFHLLFESRGESAVYTGSLESCVVPPQAVHLKVLKRLCRRR